MGVENSKSQSKVALRRELRRRWREERARTTATAALQNSSPYPMRLSPAAHAALRELWQRQPGPVVIYEALPDELDLSDFCDFLERQGAPMWVPVVRAAHGVALSDLPLGFRPYRSSLSPTEDASAHQTLPRGDAATLDPRTKLILVPACALGRDGARLGRGGGWYDRALAALRATNPQAVVVGCVPSARLLAAGVIAREAHDQNVDLILTESALLTPTRPFHS